MADLATMPISTPARRSRSEKGFSLLEMMLVLAIIGAIVALGLGRIRKRDNDIKKAARDFYVLGKEIRNHARLKNSTYRLVIQLDEGQQQYWIESTQGYKGRVDEKEFEKLREEERPTEVFQKDDSLMKKEKKLPNGIFFKSVETLDKEPISVGVAKLYFFSNGFVEAAAIQITDRKSPKANVWTLVFHPLTGQADIIPEERSLRDVKRE